MIIEGLLIIIATVVVTFIVGFSVERNKYKKTKARLERNFDSLTDFCSTYKTVQSDFIFAVDDTHQNIAVINKTLTKIIPFEQICKVEYVENGKTISNNSAVKKGILAGAVAAATGIAILSFSSETKKKKLISSMQIKITLRDNPEPYIYLPLIEYNINGGFDPSSGTWSMIYEDQLRIVNEIFDCFKEINNKVYNNAPKKDVPENKGNKQSVADELSKLAKLKDEVILTESEFEAQKQKILNQ